MKTGNFNSIAPFYDSIAHLVFGRNIHDASIEFFNFILPGSTILVIGGGTGQILPSLLSISDTKIWYVEKSPAMIKRAKQRCPEEQRLCFILGNEEDVPEIAFDVVVTCFFLDVLDNAQVFNLAKRLATRPGREWYVADFVDEARWHGWMLKLMYKFFAAVAQLGNRALPSWQDALSSNGFSLMRHSYRFGGFIKSCQFRL
jgi:tRNA (cmo5U34)-methyltransferase